MAQIAIRAGVLLALPLLLWLATADAFAGGSSGGRAWGSNYFPNTKVVNQDGKELNFYDDLIKGRIVVFSFIYTRCKDICPLTTARLAEVQDALGDAFGRDIFFYSVTIDPKHDGPKELKAYADAFNVKPGWQFLTAPPEVLLEIRQKLGERSRKLTEHRNDVVLGNDRTGEWQRDSSFSGIRELTDTIRSMDPAYREKSVAAEIAATNSDPIALPETGAALFVKACAACHTIGGGKRVGPDLKGVTGRRERDWLTAFIMDAPAMIERGDPTAKQLFDEYNHVRMPALGLTANDAGDLIDYLASRSRVAAAGG